MAKPENGSPIKSLGNVLVETGLISAEQLESALKIQRKQGKELGEVLIAQSMLTPEQLAMALSIQLNMPLIDLKRHTVQPRALRLIPEDVARKHTLIPLDIVGDSMVVVMTDPTDIRIIEDLQTLSKMRVEPALGVSSDIEEAIILHYRASSEIEKKVKQFTPAEESALDANSPAMDTLTQTPVTQTLDLLIEQAVKDRASDLHIEPQESRLRIRYRIDGILHDAASLPMSAHSPLVTRLKIMAGMNIAEHRRPQDGQISIKVDHRDIDIRAATTETAYGERVTLRILDKELSLIKLERLGFSPDSLAKYQRMLKSSFGMILIGGPTGSGKTTTLYASINQLDRNELNIMTIEDPIEYHFKDINQIQVNAKAGITFATGLRALMRHDPDILLVGEIRDGETANVAGQSALTGHLVFSSVHANDSIGVLFRLIDLGVEPYLIASTVVGVVAQRMIRRICPHCTAKFKPSEEEIKAYEAEMGPEETVFYHGVGCNFCKDTGYLGRTGVFEIFVMSEQVRRMLVNRASAGEIRSQALSDGLVTMRYEGMKKVKEGITTPSEVLKGVFFIGQ